MHVFDGYMRQNFFAERHTTCVRGNFAISHTSAGKLLFHATNLELTVNFLEKNPAKMICRTPHTLAS